MRIALDLLRASRVGVREFKENLSKLLHKRRLLVVSEHGRPTSVIVPYEDMLELLDVYDELQDTESMTTVAEGRKAVKKGAKGISAARLFKKIRALNA